jgi:trk system potassium uptake protein TrkH
MNFNIKVILKMIGAVAVLIGVAMVPSLIVSLLYGETALTRVFLLIIVAQVICGLLLFLVARQTRGHIRIRDGLLSVAVCWIVTCLLGALPYTISGVIPSYLDAFFEAASGFTTTGVSLISDMSTLPKSLLFWRAMSNWIGGMGILIFAISILPALGVGSVNIINAENTGSAIERIRNRMSDNARHVYLLYITLTILAFFLLFASPEMNAFDAIIHSFGSMGNSGVTTRAGGVARIGNLYVEVVISVFCVLASMNFISYKLLLQRRFRDFFKEAEIRIFLLILLTVLLLTVMVLWAKGTYGGFGECLRHSFFQVVAFVTTAGYTGVDYNVWPGFCKALLFAVVFIGGCSASTGGGMKVIRFAVMASLIRRNFYKRIHPHAVMPVKLGENAISAEKVSNITVFVLMYFFLFGLGTILLSLDGQGISTTASAVLAVLSNAGLGFGELSLGGSFQIFSSGGRLLLSLFMLIGRLEIFTIILLFSPNFWRPDHR